MEVYENAVNYEVEESTQDKAAALQPDALKAKYGKVYKIGLMLQPDDETELEKIYYFKKPSTASYDRYLKTASSGMTKATKAFVLDNVLEECREMVAEDVKEYPALAMNLAEKLLELLGLTKTTNLKLL